MKTNYFHLLIPVLFSILCCCTSKNDTSNRSYFMFVPEDRKILVPVQLNDSVEVKLVFDTGFGTGYYFMYVLMDSTVQEAYPALFSGIASNEITGSAWNKNSGQQLLRYNSSQKLRIGSTDIMYAGTAVTNWRKLMNNDFSDGIFNIPRNDTTHIWEINFENNYMEVHPADGFKMPEDCFMTFVDGVSPFCIDLPLQVKFADNDTLTINRKFLIDTGAPWDIVLLHEAPELKVLNKREDAAWIKFLGSYIRHYTVNATLYDRLEIDSMRVYTIDYPNNIGFTNYIIGLNFLKRFNLFFDMKNRQLGLQPIRNFQRLVNPLFERFHYSTQKTPDGRFVVNIVGNYRENYYKTAGLQVGDEITAINSVPYEKVTKEMADEFKKQDTVTLSIVRNGQPLFLSVKIDPNEPKGD